MFTHLHLSVWHLSRYVRWICAFPSTPVPEFLALLKCLLINFSSPQSSMRLSKSGEILHLITSLLGCISLAAASWSNSNTAEDAANLPHGNRCVTPQVRREWRALSDGEKASWISAVKVGFFSDELRGTSPSLELSPTSNPNTVVGKNPAPRICRPLPEPCELHLTSPVGREHFHVGW